MADDPQVPAETPAEITPEVSAAPVADVPAPAVTTGPMVPVEPEPVAPTLQVGISLHLSTGEVLRAAIPEGSTVAGLLGAGGFVDLKHPDGGQTLTVNAAHIVYFYE